MKRFLTRILLSICAIVAICEGVLFVIIRLGRISVEQAASAYASLLQSPEGMHAIPGLVLGFLCLGAGLLATAVRRDGNRGSISMEDGGEALRVRLDTVRDFIDQMLERNHGMSEFETAVRCEGAWVYIDISAVFDGAVPIRQRISRIRHALREDIIRVFEFSSFRINFEVNGISTDPGQSDPGPGLVQADEAQGEETGTDSPDAAPGRESVSEKKPWQRKDDSERS